MRNIAPHKFFAFASRLVKGARHSILVRCNTHIPFVWEQRETAIENMLRQAGRKIHLRILLGVIESEGEYLESELERVSEISQVTNQIENRNLRISHEWSGNHAIIVDNATALETDCGLPPRRGPVHLYTAPPEIDDCRNRFERHWDWAHPLMLFVQDQEVDSQHLIHVASEQQWSELITLLLKNPKLMYSIPPRAFEEFVAELLVREGLEVHLTPRTRDGGRDILVWHSTSLGPFLYFVECKRFAPDRPVGVGLVRQLLGVVESEGANGGMLITTSRFTRGAWGLGEKIGLRMKLADYESIIEWLQTHKPV